MKTRLTEALYRMSLEAPGQWWMVMGPGLEDRPPYLNIGQLNGFVIGYSAASEAPEDGFFIWLRDEAGAFPGDGWAREFLRRAGGNHETAIQLLFDQLHRYLLETRPEWFVRFNQEPRASLLASGLGESLSHDVRLPAHVLAVTGAEPITPPDLRVSAFEMTDGHVFTLGLPKDVGSWWNGAGRRIGAFGSAAALEGIRGSRVPLSPLVEQVEPLDVCVLDALADQATVLARGAAGAIHLRAGQLLERTTASSPVSWIMQPGDCVLILSPALFAHALEFAPGPLPASLATGQPVAWAQSVDTNERRLAVAVTWWAPGF